MSEVYPDSFVDLALGLLGLIAVVFSVLIAVQSRGDRRKPLPRVEELDRR